MTSTIVDKAAGEMMSKLVEGVKINKNFDLLCCSWNEAAELFGNSAVGGGAPTSPDTVSFDKPFLDPSEPLLSDAGMFNFDGELCFSVDKSATGGLHDFDTFRFFEQPFHSSLEADKPKESAIQLAPPPPPSAETQIEERTKAKKTSKKRSKSSVSSSSDTETGSCSANDDTDSNSETTTKSSKKIKASPKFPRSRQPTSPFRGVSRCTKDGRWQARIRVAKEVVYLGRFPTEEQAAKRYDEAARLHHGTQAMLNFATLEDIVMGRKSVFSASGAAVNDDEI